MARRTRNVTRRKQLVTAKKQYISSVSEPTWSTRSSPPAIRRRKKLRR